MQKSTLRTLELFRFSRALLGFVSALSSTLLNAISSPLCYFGPKSDSCKSRYWLQVFSIVITLTSNSKKKMVLSGVQHQSLTHQNMNGESRNKKWRSFPPDFLKQINVTFQFALPLPKFHKFSFFWSKAALDTRQQSRDSCSVSALVLLVEWHFRHCRLTTHQVFKSKHLAL